MGLETSVSELQFDDDALPIAKINFSKIAPTDCGAIDNIRRRHNDRSHYLDKNIKSAILRHLEQSWSSNNVKIVTTQDRKLIEHVATLSGKGIRLAFSNPAFRRELASLINSTLRPKDIGIAGGSLGLSPLRSIIEPMLIRTGLNSGGQGHAEEQRVLASSALMFVISSGDTPKYWLESGQAYEAAVLTATRLGLAHSTTAAATEAADYHEDIESALKTDWRLQTIVRLGYSENVSFSTPRLPTEQLLT